MRILVTGGAGYVGSHAVRLLAEHGHEVWVFDNLSTGHAAAVPSDRLIVADLADAEALESTLRERRIEAVMHFAALALVGESVRDPLRYYRANLAHTLGLLEAMRRAEVPRIVFSSSAAVYGTPQSSPIAEDAPTRPINPYGRTKLAVEWLLEDARAAQDCRPGLRPALGLAYAALRYFNAAGASPGGAIGEDHRPESHLIPLVLQAALGQRPAVDILGTDYPTPDGTCVRDYVHVDDLAAAHLAAVERLRPGDGWRLNLGTGRGQSVREVVRVCREVSGRDIAVREAPRREGDPPELVAAPGRAATLLGWQPRYRRLPEIVETAWRWHRDHPHGYGA
jgi:UDP-glucose 4-epimerase